MVECRLGWHKVREARMRAVSLDLLPGQRGRVGWNSLLPEQPSMSRHKSVTLPARDPSGQGALCGGASAADRWAMSVLELAHSLCDPKTLTTWADAAHCGYGTIRMRCYAAGVPPGRSLLFARLLRLVTMSQSKQLNPEEWLDVADPRALRSLLRRGGLPRSGRFCPTIEQYIACQRLLPVDCAALRALKRRLGLAR